MADELRPGYELYFAYGSNMLEQRLKDRVKSAEFFSNAWLRDVTTYLARRGRIDESLKPYTWYRDLILCGAEQHGMPEDYRGKLGKIHGIPDPDENRREKRKAEEQMQEYLSLRKLQIKDITERSSEIFT